MAKKQTVVMKLLGTFIAICVIHIYSGWGGGIREATQ